MVRVVILILLVVLILPWGGMAAAYAARPVPVMVQADQSAKLSAPRQCRGGFLPGSPCTPERFLQDEAAVMRQGAASVVRVAVLDWAWSGWVDAPPREPPRQM